MSEQIDYWRNLSMAEVVDRAYALEKQVEYQAERIRELDAQVQGLAEALSDLLAQHEGVTDCGAECDLCDPAVVEMCDAHGVLTAARNALRAIDAAQGDKEAK